MPIRLLVFLCILLLVFLVQFSFGQEDDLYLADLNKTIATLNTSGWLKGNKVDHKTISDWQNLPMEPSYFVVPIREAVFARRVIPFLCQHKRWKIFYVDPLRVGLASPGLVPSEFDLMVADNFDGNFTEMASKHPEAADALFSLFMELDQVEAIESLVYAMALKYPKRPMAHLLKARLLKQSETHFGFLTERFSSCPASYFYYGMAVIEKDAQKGMQLLRRGMEVLKKNKTDNVPDYSDTLTQLWRDALKRKRLTEELILMIRQYFGNEAVEEVKRRVGP